MHELIEYFMDIKSMLQPIHVHDLIATNKVYVIFKPFHKHMLKGDHEAIEISSEIKNM